MLWIQILFIIFFLFAISRVVLRYRKNELKISEFLFWILFWILAVLFVIAPDSSFYFAKLLGVARGADLIVYLALALLFFLVFKLTVKLEKINREITKITRQNALSESAKIKNNE